MFSLQIWSWSVVLFFFFLESYHSIITLTSLLTDFQCEACFAHIWGEKIQYKYYNFIFFNTIYREKTLSVSEFRAG